MVYVSLWSAAKRLATWRGVGGDDDCCVSCPSMLPSRGHGVSHAYLHWKLSVDTTALHSLLSMRSDHVGQLSARVQGRRVGGGLRRGTILQQWTLSCFTPFFFCL